MTKTASKPNRYKALIERIFGDRYTNGAKRIEFERDELIEMAGYFTANAAQAVDRLLYMF